MREGLYLGIATNLQGASYKMSICRLSNSWRVCALTIVCFVFVACSSETGDKATANDSPGVPPGSDETTTGAALPNPDGSSPPESVPAPNGDDSEPGSKPTPAPPPQPTEGPLPYRGVNLAGGEFGDKLPGTENVDYRWPTNSEVDYFVSKGMNTFRVAFKWERLQRTAYGEFEAAYLSKLDGLVAYATSKGANVILEPHNFARYYGETVGSSKVPSAVFANLWSRIAKKYAGNTRAMFNLVNEPHDISSEQWVSAANDAISAIRAAGANNLIHVPGNGWTGAHSWASSYYGTSNTVAMLDIVDPANHIVFEVHQYLDSDSSGSSDRCVDKTVGSQRLQGFISWLRKNGKKGFVGEFAGGDNATCNEAVKDMLDAMTKAADVLVGWSWWAAGPGWGDYIFTIEPKNGKDRPQMTLLLPYLFGTSS